MGLALAMLGAVAAAAGTSSAMCYPSGLRVAVIPRSGRPMVAVGAVVRGGSQVELADEHGVAHFLEHLWFRSVREDGRTVNQILEDAGAQANAYTTHDETIYLTVAHRDALATLLSLEAQRTLDPLGQIPVEDVARERDVVRNELRERFDGGAPLLGGLLSTLVADPDPYARPVGGTDESVAALTWQVAQAYADRHYDPEFLSLVLVGDVEGDEVRRLLPTAVPRRMLADPRLPRDIRARPCDDKELAAATPAPLGPSTGWRELEGKVDAPLAMAVWPAGSGFEDAEAARLAAAIAELELDEHNIDGGCDVVELQRLNALYCTFPLARGREPRVRVDKAIARLDRLWERAADDGLGPALQEFAWLFSDHRRRTGITASERLDVSATGYLSRIATQFHWWHRPRPPLSVPPARLRLLHRDPSSARRLVVYPAQTAYAGADIHARRGSVAEKRTSSRADEPLTAELLASLVVPPPVDRLRRERLPSGLEAWVVSWPDAPRTHLALVHPAAPHWTDSAARVAATWALAEPEDQLETAAWGELWRQGTTLGWTTDTDHWTLEVSAPSLEPAAAALRAVLPDRVRLRSRRAARRTAAGMAQWRSEMTARPVMIAEHARWRALADGLLHPMLDDAGFEPILDVSRAEVRRFARDALAPERARLVAVVNTDPDQALEQLALALNAARRAQPVPPIPAPPPRPAAPRHVVVVPDPLATQASVGLACHVGEANPLTTTLIRAVLEHRLNQELRNDLGATYGVGSGQYWEAHGPTLEIDTDVPPALAGRAVRALLHGIERVARRDVGSSELDDRKRDVARASVSRWQTADEVVSWVRGQVLAGSDPRAYDLAGGLLSIDGAQLARSLEPCVGRESVTVVGRLDAIDASLRAAGFGTSEVSTARGSPAAPDTAGSAP